MKKKISAIKIPPKLSTILPYDPVVNLYEICRLGKIIETKKTNFVCSLW